MGPKCRDNRNIEELQVEELIQCFPLFISQYFRYGE